MVEDEQVTAWWCQVLDLALADSEPGDRPRWGEPVPFSAVHDWHLNTVAPLAGSAYDPVARLHARALDGEQPTAAEWIEVLEPALREIYQRAYAYDEAYATAAATARTYARSHDFTEAETAEFADSYARLNTAANVRSFADANAIANARALGGAFATGDQQAYADTYPLALVRAHALAYAHQGEPADRPDRRRIAYRRLVDGLVDSLRRLSPTDPGTS